MTKAELRYVIHNRVVLKVFPDIAAERMYQIRLYREAFREGNQKVFRLLKEYLNKSPGWAWTERFNLTEN